MASLTFGPRVPWEQGTGFVQAVEVDAVAFTVSVHEYGELLTLATVRSAGGSLMASLPVARGCDATTALEAAGIIRRCGACAVLVAMWHFDDAADCCEACSAFHMLQASHRMGARVAVAS